MMSIPEDFNRCMSIYYFAKFHLKGLSSTVHGIAVENEMIDGTDEDIIEEGSNIKASVISFQNSIRFGF